MCCAFLKHYLFDHSLPLKTKAYDFKPSKLMDKPDIHPWLKNLQHTEECINTVLSVIAPDLFNRALEAIEEIKARPGYHFGEVAKTRQKVWPSALKSVQLWPTVFSGLAVITNRKTPSHRDDSGHHPWYDVLYSGGRHRKANLKVVDFNATFNYKPGFLVALCGRTFRHQVMDYEGPDRICIAHYMRYDVMERMKLKAKDAEWVPMETLFSLCHEDFQANNLCHYISTDN